MSENVIGAVSLGLSAAVAWGAADFTGGYTSRRTGVYGVVIGAEIIGLILLIPTVVLMKEPIPTVRVWLLAGLAGLCGGFGLTLLYRALASGQMSIAAPVSALLGAALPVITGMAFQGLPETSAVLGIGLALAAILLVSYSEGDRLAFNFAALSLPLAAGITFGLFFILLHQASQSSILWPIVATRLASVAFLILFAVLSRQRWASERRFWPFIFLIGLLDTAGNVFFVIAGQLGRLDFTAVLSSLYPASTVLLAWLILKERVSTVQSIGILIALLAILLIVM